MNRYKRGVDCESLTYKPVSLSLMYRICLETVIAVFFYQLWRQMPCRHSTITYCKRCQISVLTWDNESSTINNWSYISDALKTLSEPEDHTLCCIHSFLNLYFWLLDFNNFTIISVKNMSSLRLSCYSLFILTIKLSVKFSEN